MLNIYILLSSTLALLSYASYMVAILRGKAKPHRTTRFVVLIITVLSTASLWAQGSFSAVWLSGAFMLGSLVIFLLSLEYGVGGWAKADIVCLFIACTGILLWKITAHASVALLDSIIADLAGQIPMLVKTYRFPETEVWYFYFLDVLAAIINIMAMSKFGSFDLVYPLYIVIIDGLVIALIWRKKLKKASTLFLVR